MSGSLYLSLLQAYFNRANCYRRLGRVALAVADLRVAVGADASQATGHNSLGLALCEMGALRIGCVSLLHGYFVTNALRCVTGRSWS